MLFNQLGCLRRKAHGVGAPKAKVDLDVAAVGPTQFLQALRKFPNPGLNFRIIFRDRA
jgi:hypothetical protein